MNNTLHAILSFIALWIMDIARSAGAMPFWAFYLLGAIAALAGGYYLHKAFNHG